MVYNDAPEPSDHRIVTTNVYDNVFYSTEDVVLTISGTAAVTWVVEDYWGNEVDSGPLSGTSLNLGPLPLGFYTLFLPRVTPIGPPYNGAGGEARFCVVRPDTVYKPRVALGTERAKSDRTGQGFDMPMRAFCGVGPVRHQIRLTNDHYAADKAAVLLDIPYERSLRNIDADRPLQQFVAFADFDDTTEQLTNLADAIPALVAAGVTWFEGKNEPGAEINNPGGENSDRLQAFASAVHAASASAKVLGPCPISVEGDWMSGSGGQARWNYDMLRLNGSVIDVISYHNYNSGQGSLAQSRQTLEGLESLLTHLGLQNKPRFNTEFGSAFAASNAVADHRQQAKNIMMDLQLSEQYKVPKEHTYYFYDLSHGFWGFPSWWLHAEGARVMPTALVPMFRVWGEELWGKTFSARLNFGDADDMFVGSRFVGGDGASLLTLQSSGESDTVNISVTGATQLTTVDAFGKTTVRQVVDGKIAVPVTEIPSYVRVPSGATANVIPANWGVETFRSQFAVASANTNSVNAKNVVDGVVTGRTPDWIGSGFPAWVDIDFPVPTRFNRVTIFCGNPVNSDCTLLDFDIRVRVGLDWFTIATFTEPLKQRIWTTYKAAGATYIESYWSRRNEWSYRHPEALIGNAIRIYVRAASYGGSGTVEAYNQNPGAGAGLQIGLSDVPRPQIREVRCHLNEYDLGKTNNVPLLIH